MAYAQFLNICPQNCIWKIIMFSTNKCMNGGRHQLLSFVVLNTNDAVIFYPNQSRWRSG